jgi:putative membrane protein
MKILIRFLVIAAALGVAAWLVPGIVLTGHDHLAKVETLLIVAVIFGVVNILIKPIIKTVGCAFYVLTLGLFAIVVNGLLLWLTSYIAFDKLHEPFHVTGFLAAVEGALVVAVISFIAHLVIPDDGDRR